MTVSRVSITKEEGRVLVRCVWLLENGTKQQEVFEATMLQGVKQAAQ